VARILSIHSFRGGTGKSNVAANLATALACAGQRVALLDTDLPSPGVHAVFGVQTGELLPTLNDFLWGGCAITEAATT